MAEIVYEGQQEILKRFLGIKSNGNLNLHLFTDDRTPELADTVSNFTEVSGGGYAEITIPSTDWNVSLDSTTVKMVCNEQSFTFTSQIPRINGYYLTTEDNLVLIDAKRFSDAPIENYNEGSLAVNLTITIGT
ncbi:MAG: hypothetical protein GF311_28535 [Candidatus Lokiarchaeota archaeon]|nr:hypothetical protein [Candidatus Lokiarchaeota archaeon]